MKTYLRQLVWIPILLLLFSCAETDDLMVDIDETDPLLRIDAIVAQLVNRFGDIL